MNNSSMAKPHTLLLVAGTAQHADKKLAAGDYYTSVWFLKAREWALQHSKDGVAWFVLHPTLGVVSPQLPIAKEDGTLTADWNGLQWALNAEMQLCERGVPTKVWLLAGKRYRDWFAPLLQSLGIKVMEPLANLAIGQQLRWLKITMNIDLKELERDVQAMSEEEVAAAVLAIQRVRMTASTTAAKDRAKSQRELLRELREAMAKDPELAQKLLGPQQVTD